MCVLQLAGCLSPSPAPNDDAPAFADWYTAASSEPLRTQIRPEQGPLVTLSAQDMPLVDFARYLADQAGVSMVVSSGLDGQAVTIEVTDIPVDSVIALVARRLGVEANRSGGVYFLGELRPEDRAVYVRSVKRLDSDGLKQALGVIISANGRLETFDDGLVVLADKVEVVQRVANLVDQIEAAPSQSWVVQLYLLSLRGFDFKELGLDAVPAADIAIRAATTGGSTFELGAALNGVLLADQRREVSRIVAAPLFVLLDGSEASIADGQVLRVPQRTVSSEGTVTITGFEQVQTGLDAVVRVRDLGSGRATLDLDISISEVTGFLEDLPQVQNQQFATKAAIESGGVYLLGSLSRGSTLSGTRGAFLSVKRDESDQRTVYVWARTYRIGSPGDSLHESHSANQAIPHTRRETSIPPKPAMGGGAFPSPGRGETGKGSGPGGQPNTLPDTEHTEAINPSHHEVKHETP